MFHTLHTMRVCDMFKYKKCISIMAITKPATLPTMYIRSSDVLSELDDYGIRDITSAEPVLGLVGVIKEAALFISTHFDFKGVKCENKQLLAFPREEINDDFNYEIPECIKTAQMSYVLEILRPCDETGVTQLGLIRSSKRIGDFWLEQEFSTNPFMLKLNAIMEPLLKNEGLSEFMVGE